MGRAGASISGDKEVQMLDFTDGSTWFFAGLSVTALFVAIVVVFAFVAQRVENR